MGKWLANDERNQTWSKLVLAQTNAENIAELAQRSTTYYEHSAYYASADLYREQTENSEVHTYDSDYVLDHSMSDVLEMLKGMKGTVHAFVLNDECRGKIWDIEKDIKAALGIPVLNKGVEECLKRQHVACGR